MCQGHAVFQVETIYLVPFKKYENVKSMGNSLDPFPTSEINSCNCREGVVVTVLPPIKYVIKIPCLLEIPFI